MPIINTVIQGGGTTPEKYPLLSRVIDDSNNEIGTVCGYHIDANNQKYAIVCLDAAYRLASASLLSHSVAISGLPSYTNAIVYGAQETATFNCDKILEQCATSGYTSDAVSHCRSKTFTIEGVQYAGQLPAFPEAYYIFKYRTEIDNADPTASSYSSLVIPTTVQIWTSSQYSTVGAWVFGGSGNSIIVAGSTVSKFVLPVLEIPVD